jgi:hypothetical protein
MLNEYTIKTTEIDRKNVPLPAITVRGVKPCSWNYTLVEIFTNNTKVGQYVRNYPHILHTFCPFHYRGTDYALISRDFLRTSIIRLPDCKYIASVGAHNFQPVCYHVPMISPEMIGQYDQYGHEIIGPNVSWALVAGTYYKSDQRYFQVQCIDMGNLKAGYAVQDRRFGFLELLTSAERLKDTQVPYYTTEEWINNSALVKIPYNAPIYMPSGSRIRANFVT